MSLSSLPPSPIFTPSSTLLLHEPRETQAPENTLEENSPPPQSIKERLSQLSDEALAQLRQSYEQRRRQTPEQGQEHPSQQQQPLLSSEPLPPSDTPSTQPLIPGFEARQENPPSVQTTTRVKRSSPLQDNPRNERLSTIPEDSILIMFSPDGQLIKISPEDIPEGAQLIDVFPEAITTRVNHFLETRVSPQETEAQQGHHPILRLLRYAGLYDLDIPRGQLIGSLQTFHDFMRGTKARQMCNAIFPNQIFESTQEERMISYMVQRIQMDLSASGSELSFHDHMITAQKLPTTDQKKSEMNNLISRQLRKLPSLFPGFSDRSERASWFMSHLLLKNKHPEWFRNSPQEAKLSPTKGPNYLEAGPTIMRRIKDFLNTQVSPHETEAEQGHHKVLRLLRYAGLNQLNILRKQLIGSPRTLKTLKAQPKFIQMCNAIFPNEVLPSTKADQMIHYMLDLVQLNLTRLGALGLFDSDLSGFQNLPTADQKKSTANDLIFKTLQHTLFPGFSDSQKASCFMSYLLLQREHPEWFVEPASQDPSRTALHKNLRQRVLRQDSADYQMRIWPSVSMADANPIHIAGFIQEKREYFVNKDKKHKYTEITDEMKTMCNKAYKDYQYFLKSQDNLGCSSLEEAEHKLLTFLQEDGHGFSVHFILDDTDGEDNTYDVQNSYLVNPKTAKTLKEYCDINAMENGLAIQNEIKYGQNEGAINIRSTKVIIAFPRFTIKNVDTFCPVSDMTIEAAPSGNKRISSDFYEGETSNYNVLELEIKKMSDRVNHTYRAMIKREKNFGFSSPAAAEAALLKKIKQAGGIECDLLLHDTNGQDNTYLEHKLANPIDGNTFDEYFYNWATAQSQYLIPKIRDSRVTVKGDDGKERTERGENEGAINIKDTTVTLTFPWFVGKPVHPSPSKSPTVVYAQGVNSMTRGFSENETSDYNAIKRDIQTMCNAARIYYTNDLLDNDYYGLPPEEAEAILVDGLERKSSGVNVHLILHDTDGEDNTYDEQHRVYSTGARTLQAYFDRVASQSYNPLKDIIKYKEGAINIRNITLTLSFPEFIWQKIKPLHAPMEISLADSELVSLTSDFHEKETDDYGVLTKDAKILSDGVYNAFQEEIEINDFYGGSRQEAEKMRLDFIQEHTAGVRVDALVYDTDKQNNIYDEKHWFNPKKLNPKDPQSPKINTLREFCDQVAITSSQYLIPKIRDKFVTYIGDDGKERTERGENEGNINIWHNKLTFSFFRTNGKKIPAPTTTAALLELPLVDTLQATTTPAIASNHDHLSYPGFLNFLEFDRLPILSPHATPSDLAEALASFKNLPKFIDLGFAIAPDAPSPYEQVFCTVSHILGTIERKATNTTLWPLGLHAQTPDRQRTLETIRADAVRQVSDHLRPFLSGTDAQKQRQCAFFAPLLIQRRHPEWFLGGVDDVTADDQRTIGLAFATRLVESLAPRSTIHMPPTKVITVAKEVLKQHQIDLNDEGIITHIAKREAPSEDFLLEFIGSLYGTALQPHLNALPQTRQLISSAQPQITHVQQESDSTVVRRTRRQAPMTALSILDHGLVNAMADMAFARGMEEGVNALNLGGLETRLHWNTLLSSDMRRIIFQGFVDCLRTAVVETFGGDISGLPPYAVHSQVIKRLTVDPDGTYHHASGRTYIQDEWGDTYQVKLVPNQPNQRQVVNPETGVGLYFVGKSAEGNWEKIGLRGGGPVLSLSSKQTRKDAYSRLAVPESVIENLAESSDGIYRHRNGKKYIKTAANLVYQVVTQTHQQNQRIRAIVCNPDTNRLMYCVYRIIDPFNNLHYWIRDTKATNGELEIDGKKADKEELASMDFSGTYLRDLDFSNGNFKSSNFSHTQLINIDFRGANLKNTQFIDVDFLTSARRTYVERLLYLNSRISTRDLNTNENTGVVNFRGAKLNNATTFRLKQYKFDNDAEIDLVLNHINNNNSLLTILNSIDDQYIDLKINLYQQIITQLQEQNIDIATATFPRQAFIDVIASHPACMADDNIRNFMIPLIDHEITTAQTTTSLINHTHDAVPAALLTFIQAQCDLPGEPGQANRQRYMIQNNSAFMQLIGRYAYCENTALREVARKLYQDYLAQPNITALFENPHFQTITGEVGGQVNWDARAELNFILVSGDHTLVMTENIFRKMFRADADAWNQFYYYKGRELQIPDGIEKKRLFNDVFPVFANSYAYALNKAKFIQLLSLLNLGDYRERFTQALLVRNLPEDDNLVHFDDQKKLAEIFNQVIEPQADGPRKTQLRDSHFAAIVQTFNLERQTPQVQAQTLFCLAMVFTRYSSSLIFGTEYESPQTLRDYAYALFAKAKALDDSIFPESGGNSFKDIRDRLLGLNKAFSCTAVLSDMTADYAKLHFFDVYKNIMPPAWA